MVNWLFFLYIIKKSGKSIQPLLVNDRGRPPNGDRRAPIIHLQLTKKKEKYKTNTLHVYARTRVGANALKGGNGDGKEKR